MSNDLYKSLINTDSASLTEALIQAAIENKHQNFEFIKDVNGLAVAKALRDALDKVVVAFKEATTMAYNLYLGNLKSSIINIKGMEYLIQYKTFKQCVEFYKQEYKTIVDMIREYHAYLMYGWHLIDHLLGKEREEDDLYDFRIFSRRVIPSSNTDRAENDSTSHSI
jgi:hypothetical protein